MCNSKSLKTSQEASEVTSLTLLSLIFTGNLLKEYIKWMHK